MSDKSTAGTSRKAYAMRLAFKMLGGLMALYALLLLADKNPSEMVFSAAIVAIGSIVSALNIADGMKSGE